MAGEQPREIRSANTDLRFSGVDIVMEVMINFPEHNEKSEKPKGALVITIYVILGKLLNISKPVLLPIK